MAIGIDYNSGIPHTDGAPVHDPGTNGGKVAYDHVARVLYKHVTGTTWEVLATGGGGGTFTAGSVIFSDGSALAEDNQNLYWNDAGNLFAINKAAHQKLSTVTIQGAADATNIGGTASVSGLTITGVGTSFLTDLGIGDRISLANAPSSYVTVSTITSNTSLTYEGSGLSGSGQQINRKKAILRLDKADGTPIFLINDTGQINAGSAGQTLTTSFTTNSIQAETVEVSTLLKVAGIADFGGLPFVNLTPSRGIVASDGITIALDFGTAGLVTMNGDVQINGEIQVSDATNGAAFFIKTDTGVNKELGVGIPSGSSYDTLTIKDSTPTLKIQSPAIDISGNVSFSGAGVFSLPTLTESERDALTPGAGWIIFCTDAAADDSSTGVTQTYNGSNWKNHW